MNALLNELHHPALQKFGWSLVHLLWEGIAIAVVLSVALVMLRRRTAQARYVAGCLALAAMPIALIVTYVMLPDPPVETWAHAVNRRVLPVIAQKSGGSNSTQPNQQQPAKPVAVSSNRAAPIGSKTVNRTAKVASGAIHAKPPVERPASNLGGSFPKVVASQTLTAPAASNSTSNAESRLSDGIDARIRAILEPQLAWIVTGWLAGILALSLWHLGGWFFVHRLRTVGVFPCDDEVRRALGRLVERLDIQRTVDVCRSTRVAEPTLLGLWRPVILLPGSVLTGLTPSQLEAVLAHELAHIRRHDFLMNVVQTVIETLLFFHPAAWWISRRIRLEREDCCDDLAVATTGDRLTYARSLARLEELRDPALRHSPALTMSAAGGSLLARISRILGIERRPSARSQVVQVGATGACGILALSAVVVLWSPPAGLPRIEAFTAAADTGSRYTKDSSAPFDGISLLNGKTALAELKPGATVPLGNGEHRFDNIPEVLKGRTFTRRNGYQGILRFRVEQPQRVYFAAYGIEWGGGGNPSGDWQQELVTRSQLKKRGWMQVGKLIGEPTLKNGRSVAWAIYTRRCKRGETFAIRTHKYQAPILFSAKKHSEKTTAAVEELKKHRDITIDLIRRGQPPKSVSQTPEITLLGSKARERDTNRVKIQLQADQVRIVIETLADAGYFDRATNHRDKVEIPIEHSAYTLTVRTDHGVAGRPYWIENLKWNRNLVQVLRILRCHVTGKTAGEFDKLIAELSTRQKSSRKPQRSRKTKSAVKTLKKHVDQFDLSLDFWRGTEPHRYPKQHPGLYLYRGELRRSDYRATKAGAAKMRVTVLKIDRPQALRLIEHLADAGFFDRARPITTKEDRHVNGPQYVLTVGAKGKRVLGIWAAPPHELELGWNRKTQTRLNGLRSVLKGDAAKAMDKLLAEVKPLLNKQTKSKQTSLDLGKERVRIESHPASKLPSGLFALGPYPLRYLPNAKALYEWRLKKKLPDGHLEFIGRLPGDFESGLNRFEVERFERTGTKIRGVIRRVAREADVAGPNVNVYIRSTLPALPAGKYSVEISFRDVVYKGAREIVADKTHATITCRFEVPPKRAEKSVDLGTKRVRLDVEPVDKLRPGLLGVGAYVNRQNLTTNGIYSRRLAGKISDGRQQLVGRLPGTFSHGDRFEIARFERRGTTVTLTLKHSRPVNVNLTPLPPKSVYLIADPQSSEWRDARVIVKSDTGMRIPPISCRVRVDDDEPSDRNPAKAGPGKPKPIREDEDILKYGISLDLRGKPLSHPYPYTFPRFRETWFSANRFSRLKNIPRPWTVAKVIMRFRKELSNHGSKAESARSHLLELLAISRDPRALVLLGETMQGSGATALSARGVAYFHLAPAREHLVAGGVEVKNHQARHWTTKWWKGNEKRLRAEAKALEDRAKRKPKKSQTPAKPRPIREDEDVLEYAKSQRVRLYQVALGRLVGVEDVRNLKETERRAAEQRKKFLASLPKPRTVSTLIALCRVKKDASKRRQLLALLALSRDPRAAVVIGDHRDTVGFRDAFLLFQGPFAPVALGGIETQHAAMKTWWKNNEKRLRAEAKALEERAKKNAWSKTVDGLQLRLELKKAKFTVGENIPADIVLNNVSDKPVRFWGHYVPAPFDAYPLVSFIVQGPDGKRFFLGRPILANNEIVVPKRHTLKPRASARQSLKLNTLNTNFLGPPAFRSPGKYSVRCAYYATAPLGIGGPYGLGGRHRGKKRPASLLISPPVTITIAAGSKTTGNAGSPR